MLVSLVFFNCSKDIPRAGLTHLRYQVLKTKVHTRFNTHGHIFGFDTRFIPTLLMSVTYLAHTCTLHP